MTKELKIIWGANTQDTKIFVNDQPIGLIEKIKLKANALTGKQIIEITFPNVLGTISNLEDFNKIFQNDGYFPPGHFTVGPTLETKLDLIKSLNLLDEIPNLGITIKPTNYNNGYIKYDTIMKFIRLKAFL